MDLNETRKEDVEWIDLAHDSYKCRVVVDKVMNLLVAQDAGNFLTSCGTVSFSRKAVRHGIIC